MRVEILYFAALRELKGVARETVDVQPGTTVGQLFDDLFRDHRVPPVAYTCNQAIVAATTPLQPGDEVSFLPPVGGG